MKIIKKITVLSIMIILLTGGLVSCGLFNKLKPEDIFLEVKETNVDWFVEYLYDWKENINTNGDIEKVKITFTENNIGATSKSNGIFSEKIGSIKYEARLSNLVTEEVTLNFDFNLGNGKLIHTPKELDDIRKTLSFTEHSWYQLANDISLEEFESWEPFPYSKVSFHGNGFTIKDLKIRIEGTDGVGLFSSFEGTIDNLTVEVDIEVKDASPSVGAIAGELRGYGSHITNCKTAGKIVARGMYIGGIVGSINGGWIEDSENSVDIEAGSNSYVGGLAAYVTNKTWDGSNDKGKDQTFYSFLWGTVINSTNYRNIKSSGSYIGGVVGYIKHTGVTNRDYELEVDINNKNYGDITSTGNFVGGIYGYLEFDQLSFKLSELSNFGEIKGYNRVGGIIGQVFWTRGNVEFSNYSNSKDVTGNDLVGGIVGGIEISSRVGSGSQSPTHALVNNMTNSGEISGKNRVGGIAGAAFGETINNSFFSKSEYKIKFKGCLNSGDVYGTDNSNTGGIVGEGFNLEAAEQCNNTGSLNRGHNIQ